MRAREAVGEHHCVRNVLPSMIGLLLAAVVVLLGGHILIDRSLVAWARRITAAVAPGQQASNDLGQAAANFTRAALLAGDDERDQRIADAGEELRLAAERYDRWASRMQIGGIAATAPAVQRFEANTLDALGSDDEETQIDAAGDRLSALLHANSDAAASAALHALHRFSQVERTGRWIHLSMMLLLAGGCTALLLSALRREQLVCAHEAEVARRIDQTNADLEEFAGRVAHDLRNPLLPILSGSKVIEDTAADTPRIHDTAARIERSARRMAGMIDTLLTFSRLTHARPGAATDVCDTIDEVLDGFRDRAASEGVRLEVDCAPLAAACERIVLSSTLQNLVENALKYGRRPDAPPVVAVRARRRDGRVLVEVEDHGPGITPAAAEALFQPFWRGEHTGEGVGLGLATARRLVEARGGTIQLRRGAAGGALFEVALPEAKKDL